MSRRLLSQLARAHSRRWQRKWPIGRIEAGVRITHQLAEKRIAAEICRKDGRRIWGPKRVLCHSCCGATVHVITKLGFTRELLNQDDMPRHVWNRRRPIVDFHRDNLDEEIPF